MTFKTPCTGIFVFHIETVNLCSSVINNDWAINDSLIIQIQISLHFQRRTQCGPMTKFVMTTTFVVDRPTQLIIGIFVELAVATPVERRTFVLVVPTVKKSKLGPISFQNIRIMCIQMDKMQKTGQNSGKKCWKTLFFPATPTIWLSLAWFVAQQIRPGLICCATNQTWPEMLCLKCCAWNVVQQIRRGLICCAKDLLLNISVLAWCCLKHQSFICFFNGLSGRWNLERLGRQRCAASLSFGRSSFTIL